MSSNITLQEIGQKFLREQEEKLALTTYEKYSSILEKYVFPHIGKMDISGVDNDAIKTMIMTITEDEANTGREGTGLKSGTLKLIDQVTRMVVEYARKDGGDDRDYIEGGDTKSFERLSLSEIERLCSCAYYNHTAEMLGILLMLYTGIRIGELCALSCDDIDLEKNNIYIHRSVHRVKNKDDNSIGKTRNVISPIPSKKQIRTVKFPEELHSYIKEFYFPTCNLMTGNSLPAEAKTVRGRVDRLLEVYKIENIPFQRLHRTFVEGESDIEILRSVFCKKKMQYQPDNHVVVFKRYYEPKDKNIDKNWLCREMALDLAALRLLIGASCLEISLILGISIAEYEKTESGERPLSWNEYMTLLFFFNCNDKTRAVIEALGLYPDVLKRRMLG